MKPPNSNSDANATARGSKGKKPKAEDGRRNNKTPESGKIQSGEVRNPDGRGGKAKSAFSSEYDDHQLAAAARTVTRDTDGPVNALKRLIQEDWHDALKNGDQKARARVLAEVKAIMARDAEKQRKAFEWIWETKLDLTEKFALARKARYVPLDVMHPDHVHIDRSGVTYTGPMTTDAREQWELLKYAIKAVVPMHAEARRRAKLDPCAERFAWLEHIVVLRRKLMRSVPKRWDWREDIYCRHSLTDAVNRLNRDMQELYDAAD